MIRTILMVIVDVWLIVGLIVTGIIAFLDDIDCMNFAMREIDRACVELGTTLSHKAGSALAIAALFIAMLATVFTWPGGIKDVKRIMRKRRK